MNDSPATAVTRLLLAEDDPVSAAFLADAAALLPLRVTTVASVADALAAARESYFDLLLLDAHLPDGSGIDLLHWLRMQGQAAAALAHTAQTDAVLRPQLHAAGFCEVLHKPLAVAELHAALRRHLQAPPPPAWDDAAALAALGGRPPQVAALRTLFLAELPDQRARLILAVRTGNAAAVSAELHRLIASCGFVGAAGLAQAVQALRTAPLDISRWQALDAVIAALLSAPAPAPPAAPG